MLKKKKIVTAVTLIIGVILLQGSKIYASDLLCNDDLASYEAKLEELNIELGTDYKLEPTDEFSYDEMVSYFTNMSMEEFEAYIKNAYQQEEELDEIMQASLQEIADGNNNMRSTLSTQRYYYDGNSNSLYFKAYTTKVSGTTVYTGDVSATGSTISSYPAYKSSSCTVSFSDDKKTAKCTWKCVKYLSANVISSTSYKISCTFTAGGGSVHPIV